MCLFVSPGEKVDLFTFPPVCLPERGRKFSGSIGSVYGGCSGCLPHLISSKGWGQDESGVLSDYLKHVEVDNHTLQKALVHNLHSSPGKTAVP